MEIELLTGAFRHAITFARSQDVRYIIHSLCIIQVDSNDKKSESKYMGVIYELAEAVMVAVDIKVF